MKTLFMGQLVLWGSFHSMLHQALGARRIRKATTSNFRFNLVLFEGVVGNVKGLIIMLTSHGLKLAEVAYKLVKPMKANHQDKGEKEFGRVAEGRF